MTAALEGGCGSASCTSRSLPLVKTRCPLYRRLGGPQGRSGHVQKISPPTGIRSPYRPTHSQSLYRLRYPAHQYMLVWVKLVSSVCSQKVNVSMSASVADCLPGRCFLRDPKGRKSLRPILPPILVTGYNCTAGSLWTAVPTFPIFAPKS
jgi:hypothetical protein